MTHLRQCGCATVGKLSTTECGVASVRAGLGTLASVPPLTGMNESHHSPGGDQEETETPWPLLMNVPTSDYTFIGVSSPSTTQTTGLQCHSVDLSWEKHGQLIFLLSFLFTSQFAFQTLSLCFHLTCAQFLFFKQCSQPTYGLLAQFSSESVSKRYDSARSGSL